MFITVNGVRLFFDAVGEKSTPEARRPRAYPAVPASIAACFRPGFVPPADARARALYRGADLSDGVGLSRQRPRPDVTAYQASVSTA